MMRGGMEGAAADSEQEREVVRQEVMTIMDDVGGAELEAMVDGELARRARDRAAAQQAEAAGRGLVLVPAAPAAVAPAAAAAAPPPAREEPVEWHGTFNDAGTLNDAPARLVFDDAAPRHTRGDHIYLLYNRADNNVLSSISIFDNNEIGNQYTPERYRRRGYEQQCMDYMNRCLVGENKLNPLLEESKLYYIFTADPNVKRMWEQTGFFHDIPGQDGGMHNDDEFTGLNNTRYTGLRAEGAYYILTNNNCRIMFIMHLNEDGLQGALDNFKTSLTNVPRFNKIMIDHKSGVGPVTLVTPWNGREIFPAPPGCNHATGHHCLTYNDATFFDYVNKNFKEIDLRAFIIFSHGGTYPGSPRPHLPGNPRVLGDFKFRFGNFYPNCSSTNVFIQRIKCRRGDHDFVSPAFILMNTCESPEFVKEVDWLHNHPGGPYNDLACISVPQGEAGGANTACGPAMSRYINNNLDGLLRLDGPFMDGLFRIQILGDDPRVRLFDQPPPGGAEGDPGTLPLLCDHLIGIIDNNFGHDRELIFTTLFAEAAGAKAGAPWFCKYMIVTKLFEHLQTLTENDRFEYHEFRQWMYDLPEGIFINIGANPAPREQLDALIKNYFDNHCWENSGHAGVGKNTENPRECFRYMARGNYFVGGNILPAARL